MAWFVLDAIEQIDLSQFYKKYRIDGVGNSAFAPSMMAVLLIYSYCSGERSSRKIEKHCQTDIAYKVVTANQYPDHTTISRFRKDIETLEPVADFYDTIDAQSALDLFRKIQAKHPNTKVIYIIIDNARYYRSRWLKEKLKGTKIKLIFLPPYSPNLNLIERYWKFFKKKVLNNCYYENFDEFKQACKSFFQKRKKYLSELETLLAENFHIQPA